MKTYALPVVLMLCFIFSHSVAVGDEGDIEECQKKVEKLLKKAEEAKYRSQREGFLEAARIQLDLCYGRSSPKKEQSVTGPLNHIGNQIFVDSDGHFWHCPFVRSTGTVNIERDCTPQ